MGQQKKEESCLYQNKCHTKPITMSLELLKSTCRKMVHLDRLLLKDSTWANRQNEQSCLYQNKCHAKPITIYSSSLSTAHHYLQLLKATCQKMMRSNPGYVAYTIHVVFKPLQVSQWSTYSQLQLTPKCHSKPLHNSILKTFPNKAQQETQTAATNLTPYLHPLALVTKQL